MSEEPKKSKTVTRDHGMQIESSAALVADTETPIETGIFDEPTGDLPEHYAAIGRLITSFSNIERALNDVLRTVVNLSQEMGRAVTGEMRAADLIAALRRVVKARELDAITAQREVPPNPDAMDPLFTEIGNLKVIRDHIAHHRFLVRERELLFINMDTARNTTAVQFNRYSVEELNEMAEYAGRLASRVYLLRGALMLETAVARMTRDPTLLEIPARLRSKDRGPKARQQQSRPPRSSPA
jgi:hypothetical protein